MNFFFFFFMSEAPLIIQAPAVVKKENRVISLDFLLGDTADIVVDVTSMARFHRLRRSELVNGVLLGLKHDSLLGEKEQGISEACVFGIRLFDYNTMGFEGKDRIIYEIRKESPDLLAYYRDMGVNKKVISFADSLLYTVDDFPVSYPRYYHVHEAV